MSRATSAAGANSTSPMLPSFVTGVDHHRTRFDPYAFDEFGVPDRGDHDIDVRHEVREQLSPGVAVRHGRVATVTQHAHRLPQNRTSPDDDGMLAGQRDVVRIEEPKNSTRRARLEARAAERHRRERMLRTPSTSLCGAIASKAARAQHTAKVTRSRPILCPANWDNGLMSSRRRPKPLQLPADIDVIEALLRRRDEKSEPGERRDDFRIALVVGGGGMRGGATGGMARAIQKAGLGRAFDVAYGTSSGAFIAASVVHEDRKSVV